MLEMSMGTGRRGRRTGRLLMDGDGGLHFGVDMEDE